MLTAEFCAGRIALLYPRPHASPAMSKPERTPIDLPATFAFRTEIPVLASHINYGGHLDNALLLTLVSEARMRFLGSLGYSEKDVEGAGIIVASAAVQYRSEAFHGEILQVEMAAAHWGRCGCELLWRMSEAKSQREVARGSTGIVFFDYATRKVAPVPPLARERLSSVRAELVEASGALVPPCA